MEHEWFSLVSVGGNARQGPHSTLFGPYRLIVCVPYGPDPHGVGGQRKR